MEHIGLLVILKCLSSIVFIFLLRHFLNEIKEYKSHLLSTYAARGETVMQNDYNSVIH